MALRYPAPRKLPAPWALDENLSRAINLRAVLTRPDGWKVASVKTAASQLFQDWWFTVRPGEIVDPWVARTAKIRAIHWRQAIEWVEQRHPYVAPASPQPHSVQVERMLAELSRIAA